MASYDLNRYKHLPKFGYFVYNCHFPSKSVNHSENPYAVPEDYKDDNDFLQHYRSLRLSRNTDTDYISAFPHFYYVVDLYEAIACNRPRPDLTPYIQHGHAYPGFTRQEALSPPTLQEFFTTNMIPLATTRSALQWRSTRHDHPSNQHLVVQTSGSIPIHRPAERWTHGLICIYQLRSQRQSLRM